MNGEAVSPVAGALFGALALGSLAFWLVLMQRRPQGERSLEDLRQGHEVPWRGRDVLLIVLFFLMFQWGFASVGAHLEGIASEDDLQELAPSKRAAILAWSSAGSFAGVLAGVLLLRLGAAANNRDLGLPPAWKSFAGDVLHGLAGFVAAILPVYGIQLLTTILMPYEHPVLEMLQDRSQHKVWAAATVSAIVIAPIAEEFVFRLALQGWLEKAAVRIQELAREQGSSPSPKMARWGPIVLSSLCFALMHLGQGLAPVPLFFLALGLGYIYQATHRIVPCVAMHAAFNGFSLLVLRLSLPGG